VRVGHGHAEAPELGIVFLPLAFLLTLPAVEVFLGALAGDEQVVVAIVEMVGADLAGAVAMLVIEAVFAAVGVVFSGAPAVSFELLSADEPDHRRVVPFRHPIRRM
jgi:hypothetical protein